MIFECVTIHPAFPYNALSGNSVPMFQFMYSIQCMLKSPYHQTVSWVLFIFLMSCQITIITTMMTDSERMLLKSVQMKPEVYISISI